jgi:hypothetical protein
LTNPLAFGFTVILKALTDTAFNGHALSLAVTVKLYGSDDATPSAGVQQNLPDCSLAEAVITLNVAPGIPLFQVILTLSGGGRGAGGGGT